MHWAHAVFPTFKRARMHGGNPGARDVYGYTAWLDDSGYVSIHNPSREPKSYSFTLNRVFGLTPSALAKQTAYQISSPIDGSLEGLEKTCTANSTRHHQTPARRIWTSTSTPSPATGPPCASCRPAPPMISPA